MNRKTHCRFYAQVKIAFLLLMVIGLSFCSKSGGDGSSDATNYAVQITYNETYPEVSTYYGSGDATFYDYGDHGKIEGTITVGGATYEAEFEGTLSGTTFTVTTTTFQVKYEVYDQAYTEEITIDFDAFNVSGEEVTATGDYTAVTNPGNTTESGTVTFVATKIRDLNSNTITDL